MGTYYTRSGIEKAILKDKIKSFYDFDIYEREKLKSTRTIKPEIAPDKEIGKANKERKGNK